jgi:hypothetical protein
MLWPSMLLAVSLHFLRHCTWISRILINFNFQIFSLKKVAHFLSSSEWGNTLWSLSLFILHRNAKVQTYCVLYKQNVDRTYSTQKLILYFEEVIIWSSITDLMNASPANSSVNTVQHAKIDGAVASKSSVPRAALLTDQWSCMVCTMQQQRLCVFCAWSVPRWYKRIREWKLTSLELRVPRQLHVTRRGIRRISVWRYVCCNTSILGVRNWVKLL